MQIRDVCGLINGRGFKPHEWRTVGLPIIRIQNLNGSEDFNFYSGQYNPKILIDRGQLLFAWSGSRGTSFGPHVWNSERALLNYHTWKVAVNESRASPDFLFHALRQLTGYIEDRAHGASALVHTQKWEMEKFPIPIPSSLFEQRAIAKTLSDVDTLLSALDRLIAKKRDIKQAAMQQLLTGQTRLPGFHGEWEVKRLGEVATIRDGTHQTPRYVPSGIPFFSVEHVTSGDFNNTKFISEEEHRFLTRSFKIEKGDILMTRIGSIGDCKLIDWEVEASFYVSLALLKILPGHSAAYIAHYSNTAAFKREIELHSLQSAIPKKINLGPISNVKIEIPPLPEQTAIAAVLTDMDAELVAVEQRRDKTRALKQAMMQELLTGKTRLVSQGGSHA
jgi:type I restriction enzyme S subunit